MKLEEEEKQLTNKSKNEEEGEALEKNNMPGSSGAQGTCDYRGMVTFLVEEESIT